MFFYFGFGNKWMKSIVKNKYMGVWQRHPIKKGCTFFAIQKMNIVF